MLNTVQSRATYSKDVLSYFNIRQNEVLRVRFYLFKIMYCNYMITKTVWQSERNNKIRAESHRTCSNNIFCDDIINKLIPGLRRENVCLRKIQLFLFIKR